MCVGSPADKVKPLSSEQIGIVQEILAMPGNVVIVDAFNIEMTTEFIHCLRPKTWLNDEVINFYMALLCNRHRNQRNKNRNRHAQQHGNGRRKESDCYSNASTATSDALASTLANLVMT